LIVPLPLSMMYNQVTREGGKGRGRNGIEGIKKRKGKETEGKEGKGREGNCKAKESKAKQRERKEKKVNADLSLMYVLQ